MFARPFSPKLSSSKSKISLQHIKEYYDLTLENAKLKQQVRNMNRTFGGRSLENKICKTNVSNQKYKQKKSQINIFSQNKNNKDIQRRISKERCYFCHSSQDKLRSIVNNIDKQKINHSNQKSNKFQFIQIKPNKKINSTPKKQSPFKKIVQNNKPISKFFPINNTNYQNKNIKKLSKPLFTSPSNNPKTNKKLIKKNIRECYQQLKIKYNQLKLDYQGIKSLCNINNNHQLSNYSQKHIESSQIDTHTNQSSNPESKQTINNNSSKINKKTKKIVFSNSSEILKVNSQTSIQLQGFQMKNNRKNIDNKTNLVNSKLSSSKKRLGADSLIKKDNELKNENKQQQTTYYKNYSVQLQKELQFAYTTVIDLKKQIENINELKHKQFYQQKQDLAQTKSQSALLFNKDELTNIIRCQDRMQKNNSPLNINSSNSLGFNNIQNCSYVYSQKIKTEKSMVNSHNDMSPYKYQSVQFNTVFQSPIIQHWPIVSYSTVQANQFANFNVPPFINSNRLTNDKPLSTAISPYKQQQNTSSKIPSPQDHLSSLNIQKQTVKTSDHITIPNKSQFNTAFSSWQKQQIKTQIKQQNVRPIITQQKEQIKKQIAKPISVVRLGQPLSLNSSNYPTSGYYSYCKKYCQLNKCKCLFDMVCEVRTQEN